MSVFTVGCHVFQVRLLSCNFENLNVFTRTFLFGLERQREPLLCLSKPNRKVLAHDQISCSFVHIGRVFLKKILELHIRSSDAVLKTYILVADGIELHTFSENGYTTSNNSTSSCV